MYASASSFSWFHISKLFNDSMLIICDRHSTPIPGRHSWADRAHLAAVAMSQPSEPVQLWTASASEDRRTALLPAYISHTLAALRRNGPCGPGTALVLLAESCDDQVGGPYLACHAPRRSSIRHCRFWGRHCPISVDFMGAGPWASWRLRQRRQKMRDIEKAKFPAVRGQPDDSRREASGVSAYLDHLGCLQDVSCCWPICREL